MSAADDDTVRGINGRQILARLAPVDGTGSGLDADLVRGRAIQSDVFRFDPAPAFRKRNADTTVASYTFGV